MLTSISDLRRLSSILTTELPTICSPDAETCRTASRRLVAQQNRKYRDREVLSKQSKLIPICIETRKRVSEDYRWTKDHQLDNHKPTSSCQSDKFIVLTMISNRFLIQHAKCPSHRSRVKLETRLSQFNVGISTRGWYDMASEQRTPLRLTFRPSPSRIYQ